MIHRLLKIVGATRAGEPTRSAHRLLLGRVIGHELAQTYEAMFEARSLIDQADNIDAAELVAPRLRQKYVITAERLGAGARSIDIEPPARTLIHNRGTVEHAAGPDIAHPDAVNGFAGNTVSDKLSQLLLTSGCRRVLRRQWSGHANE